MEFCRKFKPQFFKGIVEGENPLAEEVIATYEVPTNPTIVLEPGNTDKSVAVVTDFLAQKNIFPL